MVVNINSAIISVTVFSDRARVTRAGSVSLQSGTHQLEFSKLPLKLNPDSVRASAHGTAQARLVGVHVDRVFFTQTPSKSIHELEEKKELIEDDIRRNVAKSQLVSEERSHLDSLAGQSETYSLALASGEMSVVAQLEIFAHLRSRSEALNKEYFDLENQKRDLARELEKLKKELQTLRSARPPERYSARVEVEILQEGDLTVELTYMISNAGWKSEYDVRLLDDGGEPSMMIGYLAQVNQRTGENWEDVTLTLSTARPALASTIPELDPWFIGPTPPIYPTVEASIAAAPASIRAKTQAVGSSGLLELEKREIRDADVVQAKVEPTWAAVIYQIPVPVTIPPDGDPYKIPVGRFPLTPELDYVSVPKLVEVVFRRASVINDSPFTLLPGKANLFTGDEYIGTTNLDFTAPMGELILHIGTADQIKVERELKRRIVDKRIISGKRRLRYGYEITIENLLHSEAKVTLEDQIPISEHEEIKVNLDFVDPKPSEQDELNRNTWEFIIAPTMRQTVRFDFSVEYPQNMKLIGLA